MYHPLDLQRTVALAVLEDGTPLASPIHVVHESARRPSTRPSAGGWLMLVVGPFVLALPWATRRPSRWARRIAAILTAVLGLVSGLAGLLVAIVLAIATVPSLAWNENFLVLVPLDLAAIGLAARWWRGTLPFGRLGHLGLRYVQLRLVVLGGSCSPSSWERARTTTDWWCWRRPRPWPRC